MYSLRKFAGRTGSIGLALPDPFPSFALGNITFRQGATSMVAGPPGSFKSIMALNMAIYWAQHGKTGLFFSADSDEYTVAKRCASMLTGEPSYGVDADFVAGKTTRYQKALRDLDSVSFVYRNLDMNGITDTVGAFEAVHGAYPDIIWIDNLLNFVDSSDEWALMRTMTRDLDILARETQAHICILHHTSEGSNYPVNRPAPRKAIQGKVSQVPRLILTVGADGMALFASCVKNTNGPQDPMARNWIQFFILPSLQIEDSQWRTV